MRCSRRDVLKAGSVGVAGTVAGCSGTGSSVPGAASECVISQAAGGPEPIDVTADGRAQDADAVLDVRWNARLQPAVHGDSEPPRDPSNNWLIFKLAVVNPTDSTVDVSTTSFSTEIETPNVVKDGGVVTFLEDRRELPDVGLKPGGQVSGFLFTEATPDAIAATLVPNLGIAFRPECDRELPIGVRIE